MGVALALLVGWLTCRDGPDESPPTETVVPRGCGAQPEQDVVPRNGSTPASRTEEGTVNATHPAPQLSLVASGTWSASGFAGDQLSGAAAARIFFSDGLVLDGGMGAWTTAEGIETDPVIALEGQLPLKIDHFGLSLYAERRLSGVDAVGLRVAFGLGGSLRAMAREGGWRPLR